MDADGTYSFSRVAAVQLEGYVGIHLSLSGHPSKKTEIELLIEYGDGSLADAAHIHLVNGINRIRIPTSGLVSGT